MRLAHLAQSDVMLYVWQGIAFAVAAFRHLSATSVAAALLCASAQPPVPLTMSPEVREIDGGFSTCDDLVSCLYFSCCKLGLPG